MTANISQQLQIAHTHHSLLQQKGHWTGTQAQAYLCQQLGISPGQLAAQPIIFCLQSLALPGCPEALLDALGQLLDELILLCQLRILVAQRLLRRWACPSLLVDQRPHQSSVAETAGHLSWLSTVCKKLGGAPLLRKKKKKRITSVPLLHKKLEEA